jgi:hypothetical protein
MFIPFYHKFPVNVTIFHKTSEFGLLCSEDNARFMREQGLEYYQLKKKNVKLKPPNYSHMLPQSNGKKRIFLYEYARDMYVPVAVSNLEIIYEHDKDGNIIYESKKMADGSTQKITKVAKVINLKAADEDMSQWSSVFRRQAEEKYRKKSWMDKYLPFLMMAMMMIFFIILSWIFMQSIADTGNNMINAISSLAGQPQIKPPG